MPIAGTVDCFAEMPRLLQVRKSSAQSQCQITLFNKRLLGPTGRDRRSDRPQHSFDCRHGRSWHQRNFQIECAAKLGQARELKVYSSAFDLRDVALGHAYPATQFLLGQALC